MASLAITKALRIVANGGAVTKDTYKGASGITWKAGALLKFDGSGKLTAVLDTSGGAATLDTDDTGTANARLFIALCDHPEIDTDPAVVALYSGYVNVQEITADTILEAQLCASSSGAVDGSTEIKGKNFALYQLQDADSYKAGGIVGLDVDNTTKPVVNVIDLESSYNPHYPGLRTDSNGDQTTPSLNYSKVTFKFLASLLA